MTKQLTLDLLSPPPDPDAPLHEQMLAVEARLLEYMAQAQQEMSEALQEIRDEYDFNPKRMWTIHDIAKYLGYKSSQHTRRVMGQPGAPKQVRLPSGITPTNKPKLSEPLWNGEEVVKWVNDVQHRSKRIVSY